MLLLLWSPVVDGRFDLLQPLLVDGLASLLISIRCDAITPIDRAIHGGAFSLDKERGHDQGRGQCVRYRLNEFSICKTENK